MSRVLFAVILSGLGLSACAGTPDAALPALAGTQWHLIEADRGALAEGARRSGITLQFEGDRIAGYTGCNQYSGSYTLAEGVLTPGPIASTKRGCLGEGAAFETQWHGLLGAPLRLSLRDDVLVATAGDGTVLGFARGAAPER